MEFEGIVYRILPAVKGQGQKGEWTKQEVVFELPGEFSRKVCVSFWGDKAQDAATLKEGESVMVSFNLESREYNGRWFTEARAWKISRGTTAVQAGAPTMPDLPPLSEAPRYASEPIDDMPF